MNQNHLNQYKKKFEKYDLVILDELGYVSFDKSGCEILFKWEEGFKDTMLTGAMVDLLAHKAHILNISTDTSHLFEETIAWLKSNNQLAFLHRFSIAMVNRF